MRPTIVFLISLALAACTSAGPINSPDFNAQLTRDVPDVEGNIELAARASYSPGLDGYDFVGLVNEKKFDLKQRGILVLTDRGVYFVADQSKKATYSIRYSGISKYDLRAAGANKRMVIRRDADNVSTFQMLNDFSYDLITRADGIVRAHLPKPN